MRCFRHLPSSAGGWVAFSSLINLSICIGQSGIDEEPIGVVPDIGNVDLTDAKKKKQKQKGGKRRNKPRFKLVRSEHTRHTMYTTGFGTMPYTVYSHVSA